MDALVFDLGGTFLRCGTAADGVVVASQQSPILNFTHGTQPEVIWARIFHAVSQYCAEHQSDVARDAPIIFSVPTPVQNGVIYNAPTVTGSAAERIDLRASIADLTGRAVHVLNDLAAAAWWVHDNYCEDRIFVVTVSSGIGSKLLVRSRSNPVIDTPMYAGEIGHIRVRYEEDAPRCGCGRPGHLSAIASGRGVLHLAQAKAFQNPAEFEASRCGAGRIAINELSNEVHIVPAAKLGDAWTMAVLREATVPLAQILITVVLAAGVEKVVVIGGFAQSLGRLYIDLLQDAVEANASYGVLPPSSSWLELAPEVQTCLSGAARFAMHINRAMKDDRL
jgi:predicted NBD/HSP70 family sugar kinase